MAKSDKDIILTVDQQNAIAQVLLMGGFTSKTGRIIADMNCDCGGCKAAAVVFNLFKDRMKAIEEMEQMEEDGGRMS